VQWAKLLRRIISRNYEFKTETLEIKSKRRRKVLFFFFFFFFFFLGSKGCGLSILHLFSLR
jgi:hypothetical protein